MVAKKKTAKKPVKKTFFVPVMISISGHVEVKAKNPAAALEAAKEEYYRLIDEHFAAKKPSLAETTVLDGPCIDVDFCEDEEDVEEDEEDPS